MYGDDDDNDDTGNDDDDDDADDEAKSLEHDGWRERAERTGCGRLSQSSQVEMPPQDWLRPSGVRVPRAMKDGRLKEYRASQLRANLRVN